MIIFEPNILFSYNTKGCAGHYSSAPVCQAMYMRHVVSNSVSMRNVCDLLQFKYGCYELRLS